MIIIMITIMIMAITVETFCLPGKNFQIKLS